MISVVIPLYNKVSFVTKTITSVLEQTFTDFELLIIDDGSTDGSLALVKEVDDPRKRLISIPHSGVSVARNTGIKEANFDWVAFLDADDRWAPAFLNEMVKAIHQHPKNSIFASGRTRLFSTYAERYEHEFLPVDGTTAVLNYFKIISASLPPINASNVIIRKTLFDEKGYFRSVQTNHEDHDLWLRLVVNEPVVFVNKSLSIYDKSAGGSQSTKPIPAASFIQYLETMGTVKEKLNGEERKDFLRYSKRFIMVTYLKNECHFSKKQAKTIRKKAKPLVPGFFQLLMDANRYLFFTNVYKLLKPML